MEVQILYIKKMTGAMVTEQRLSEQNKEYKFFYDNESDCRSSKYSINPFENFYSSRSLHIQI